MLCLIHNVLMYIYSWFSVGRRNGYEFAARIEVRNIIPDDACPGVLVDEDDRQNLPTLQDDIQGFIKLLDPWYSTRLSVYKGKKDCIKAQTSY